MKERGFRADQCDSVGVLVVDDHRMVADMLGALLHRAVGLAVRGICNDAVSALDRLMHDAPDVLVTDVFLPGALGMGLCRNARALCPTVKVVGISAHHDGDIVPRMFEAGAQAFVSKRSAPRELCDAIYAVIRGEHYLCSALSGAYPELLSAPVANRPPEIDEAACLVKELGLSQRELDVIVGIGRGHCTKEIAGGLAVSEKTVYACRQRLFRKLGVSSTAGLVKFAIRHGLATV